MALDELLLLLTQCVFANQNNEVKRLYYGISIGPAAFSAFYAFMSKIFRRIFLVENFITYLDDNFIQSQTKQDSFKVSGSYHHILLKENMKAAPE